MFCISCAEAAEEPRKSDTGTKHRLQQIFKIKAHIQLILWELCYHVFDEAFRGTLHRHREREGNDIEPSNLLLYGNSAEEEARVWMTHIQLTKTKWEMASTFPVKASGSQNWTTNTIILRDVFKFHESSVSG